MLMYDLWDTRSANLIYTGNAKEVAVFVVDEANRCGEEWCELFIIEEYAEVEIHDSMSIVGYYDNEKVLDWARQTLKFGL